MDPAFIARERVLKTCPDRRCRRSRQCRAAVSGTPCARTHEHVEAMRHRLATLLERLARDRPRDLAALDPADPDYAYKRDLRLAAFKRALERREREMA